MTPWSQFFLQLFWTEPLVVTAVYSRWSICIHGATFLKVCVSVYVAYFINISTFWSGNNEMIYLLIYCLCTILEIYLITISNFRLFVLLVIKHSRCMIGQLSLFMRLFFTINIMWTILSVKSVLTCCWWTTFDKCLNLSGGSKVSHREDSKSGLSFSPVLLFEKLITVILAPSFPFALGTVCDISLLYLSLTKPAWQICNHPSQKLLGHPDIIDAFHEGCHVLFWL